MRIPMRTKFHLSNFMYQTGFLINGNFASSTEIYSTNSGLVLCPPPKVTWLASWTENVQGQVKYIMLNPSSKLKGEKDMQKYETARKLAKSINKIRENYQADWKSKEMRIRQRAVALYFIDKVGIHFFFYQ